jgi:sec-independent protein translocase protein TatA
MNFGNMGFMEILLILVVVLLLFGAKRLPEIGASMGKGIREFKKSISDVDRSLREPERDDRLDRSYGSERIASPAREAQAEEERPEPKRLLS